MPHYLWLHHLNQAITELILFLPGCISVSLFWLMCNWAPAVAFQELPTVSCCTVCASFTVYWHANGSVQCQTQCSQHWLHVQAAGKQTDSQDTSNFCTAAQPLEVLRCTKRPVSPSSVISAKRADKWAVNRVNSGHMYRPVFNYLVVNPAKRSQPLLAQQLIPASLHPCLCFTLLCAAHINTSPLFNHTLVAYYYSFLHLYFILQTCRFAVCTPGSVVLLPICDIWFIAPCLHCVFIAESWMVREHCFMCLT